MKREKVVYLPKGNPCYGSVGTEKNIVLTPLPNSEISCKFDTFMLRILCSGILSAGLVACLSSGAPKVETEPFGSLSTGQPVTLYRMTNTQGASVEVIDYGCRVVRICVPDRAGRLSDVVVGYGDIASFESGSERFFGALIGRYANRINGARFELDGDTVSLTANEMLEGKPVHLHGGIQGFDRVMWRGEPLREASRSGVRFTRLSPDGEEGYPGNLDCTVTYWWTEDNVLRIEYEAETDAPTIVNLSNHTYFNLKGADGGSVMDHVLRVNADLYLQNNAQFVPEGPALPVEGTPFDMREPHRLDYALEIPNRQIEIMKGFSVCWVLRNQTDTLAAAADLYDPESGRSVEVWTTEPGLLTYTGRSLNEKMIGKDRKPLYPFAGMLLETLHFADSPNRPDFPTTVLRPGEHYRSVTEFRFRVH